MSSNQQSFNGLETFYFAYRDQIKSDSDAILIFVHWYLINKGLLCVNDGAKTEILPKNWNQDQEVYLLNYTFDSKGYELKVLTSDMTLIINLLKKATERTANVNCVVKEHVSNHKNEFPRVYLNLNDFYESLEKEFEILLKSDKQTTSTTSLLSEPKRGTTSPPAPAPYEPLRGGPIRPPQPAVGIGRSDLDPLHFDPMGTGGMIFDPFRGLDRRMGVPTNLPRGAVPPGARFDPFGPPNPDDINPNSTRVGPNPNHLKPPGFDDMFM